MCMSPSKTAGNPVETESDIQNRIDDLGRRIDHLDTQLHEILRILQPLADNPEALDKAVKMLGRKLPAWMGGKHG
jgi:hypothetical protein